ncbi:formyltransferase family protein [Photorhabdus bodei]|uniref:methionyl-tRNA formyltransferase n=1 Tax=Photorhabdus bodei TaxID=2029681 RepID=UPI0032B752D3
MNNHNIIICGEGHGLKHVFSGLVSTGINFILCSNDEEIIKEAKDKSIICVNHYIEAISSPKDIVLTAGYKPIIPPEHLYTARFINIHYSLLPKYRGLHSIVWAMLNGEENVGFTIHEMTSLVDQGDILYQESAPVGNKSSWDLMLHFDRRVKEVISNVLTNYSNGSIKLDAQNEEDAIYVAKRNQEDCRINWNEWDAVFFSRSLKALVKPYPLPYFIYKNKKIEILKAHIIQKDYLEINGHIVNIDNEVIWVKIPKGILKISKILIDGDELNAVDYFKRPGARLS